MQVRHPLVLIGPPWREPHIHFVLRSLAVISRKLVDFSPDSVGTFATVFPLDHPDFPGIHF